MTQHYTTSRRALSERDNWHELAALSVPLEPRETVLGETLTSSVGAADVGTLYMNFVPSLVFYFTVNVDVDRPIL